MIQRRSLRASLPALVLACGSPDSDPPTSAASDEGSSGEVCVTSPTTSGFAADLDPDPDPDDELTELEIDCDAIAAQGVEDLHHALAIPGHIDANDDELFLSFGNSEGAVCGDPANADCSCGAWWWMNLWLRPEHQEPGAYPLAELRARVHDCSIDTELTGYLLIESIDDQVVVGKLCGTSPRQVGFSFSASRCPQQAS